MKLLLQDYIHYYSKFDLFLYIRTKGNLEEFAWSHQTITGQISQRQFALRR